ncbi:MAG: glycoside hydrolase family 5 protein [Gaiellaceae bacterium]
MRNEAVSAPFFEGFVRADNGRLVDASNEPLLLRGVGLGNWLLAEGYMWKFESPGPQSPREIEVLFVDLVGEERAAQFWADFRDRFVTEADIERIAAEGMNHVRLPINSRVVMDADGALISSGLELIDRLIGWCRAHGLWVILDLHGAPGGQTGTNIDDSPNGEPELFIERRYQDQTVALWVALARRYRDEPVVAAYDLLNEPLPNGYGKRYASELVALYKRLTAAIREVDPHHLIVYEGTHWATDWSIFTEVWDANSMLQFHKYWSPPDRPSIRRYLATANDLGLPIYMGEGGENNPAWLQTAFQLYEDHGISWNFWPWKKMDTRTSPCSVEPPDGWSVVLAYAAGTAAKPSADAAWKILRNLLEAMELARCTYQPEVIAAILRRAPLRIPGVGFGFLGPARSYLTSATATLDGFRSDDLVTIRNADGSTPRTLNFDHAEGASNSSDDGLVVSLGPRDWVAYEVNVVGATKLELVVATVRTEGCEIGASIDGEPVEIEPSRDGLMRGTSTSAIAAGRHEVRIECVRGEASIRWLELTQTDGTSVHRT